MAYTNGNGKGNVVKVGAFGLDAQPVPYSAEAEEATLGAIITYPAAFDAVARFLQADDFFLLRHRHIWKTLERVQRDGVIDYITICNDLDALGKLDEIGGYAYITHLINAAPSAMNAEIYAGVVARASTRRRLLAASDMIKTAAVNQEMAIEDVEIEVDRAIMSARRASTTRLTPLRAAISKHYDQTEAAMQSPREILGLPSALYEVNKLLRGYQNQKLYIIGARPGMGKSSLLYTEAAHMARLGLPVLLATMEVGVEEVTDTLIAGETRIPADTIVTGGMDKMQWGRYVEATGKMASWPLHIDDRGGMTVEQLRLTARQMAYESGLKAIFVDYLQLMSAAGKTANRNEEVGKISRALKELSMELNIPVIAASQLSRSVEMRQDKRPVLSDLRESGNVEQDADVVIFLYREDYYTHPTPAPTVGVTELAVAKQRRGKVGMVQVGFWGELKRFVDLDKRKSSEYLRDQREG